MMPSGGSLQTLADRSNEGTVFVWHRSGSRMKAGASVGSFIGVTFVVSKQQFESAMKPPKPLKMLLSVLRQSRCGAGGVCRAPWRAR